MKLTSAILNRNRRSASRLRFIQRLRFAFRLLTAFGMQWLPYRASAENHVDYRYEYYGEEDDRITVETHSVYFEQKLIDAVIAKGEFVYDGISGATPTGSYRFSPTSGVIKTTQIEDTRLAGNLAFDCRLGNQTLTPGFAYSTESDYESYGVSLNDAIEFNDKNTTLQFGVSHNFDSVRHIDQVTWSGKDSTEAIVGLSQLLSPKTIFTAAFTFGYESGYLSDPYRQAEFVYPLHNLGVVRNEIRPGERDKQIFFTSITQFISPLDASIEGSYRFYHDSYDVFAHTVSLTWHQRLGKHVIVEPSFRVYRQSAASFYSPLFQTNPANLRYYSADYRLSEFYSLDMGLQATVIANDHLRFNLGYHRYEMQGLDGKTVSTMYPSANVFTAGVQIWF